MNLTQMTLFGVRGECFRIRKRDPLAKLAVATDEKRRSTHDARRTTERVAEGKECNAKGGASGCGLLMLLAAAVACLALACAIERRGVWVRVEWLSEYPDPVCERCGQVLNGTHAECVEEAEK